VAIVHTAQSQLAVRLAAELTSQGFHPVTVEREITLSRLELKRIATSYGAVAVMQIARTGDRVSVWISNRNEALAVLQEIHVPLDRPDALSRLAFKTVELLRASLLILPDPDAAKTAAGPPPKPAATGAPIRPEPTENRKVRARRLSLAFQPAFSYGFGKLPPLLHIGVGAHVTLYRRLGLTLAGLIPTVPMKIDEREGSADILASNVSLGLTLALMPDNHPLGVSLGAGAGPLFLRMEGHAAEPYVSRDTLLVVALPYLSTGLSAALSDIVAFRTDLLLGWAARKPVVQMLDRQVTAWARPLLSVMLGLEVRLF
jgi:hypothetical protein